MIQVLAGFSLAFIFLIIGIFFWPVLLLVPLAIIAGIIATIVKKYL